MSREHFTSDGPTEYDPDYIWLRASDNHGHSGHLRVNVPKHWGGQISQIIDSRRFGYRSQADFARDALYHRLEWAAEKLKDDRFQGRLAQDRLSASIDHYMLEQEGYAEFSRKIDEAARKAAHYSDHLAFARLVDSLRDEAQRILREPFLSQTMTKLNGLYNQFVQLLDSKVISPTSWQSPDRLPGPYSLPPAFEAD